MNKKNILLVGVLITLPVLVYQNQTALSQIALKTMQVNSNDLIAPIGGMVSTYTFSVPEEAVNPRLIGQYEVLSGLDINVEVLEQGGCPAPEDSFECIAIYSAPIEIAVMLTYR